jgi:uroporphyrinogen decarboxylase
MKEALSSRERLKIAIAGGIPDRVPAIPDFSIMIPCKLTGRPFWDILLYGKPTLFEAYCKAVEYYGIDGWNVVWGGVDFIRKNPPACYASIASQTDERFVQKLRYDTPYGELNETVIYFRDNPPTKTEKLVKDIVQDFPKIKYLYSSEITGVDVSNVAEFRKMTGEFGVFTLSVGYPGMQYWNEYFDGNLQNAIYAGYDYPEIFDEWAEIIDRDIIRQTELYLDIKPDLLLLGGSGTLTLSNPELVRKYALPTIKKVCRMAAEAGVLTMLHSCGKSLAFLDMLVNETELNCINPLEVPPMGDVNLAEVKKLYGSRIALMGNLQTTTVMLQGTPADVENAAKQAIDDAGAGGGFLLSTGDQCGRDTPPENIFKLVEVARTYGKY